jgi:hypothetical protein
MDWDISDESKSCLKKARGDVLHAYMVVGVVPLVSFFLLEADVWDSSVFSLG